MEPIIKDGRIIAAKVTVYPGDEEQYFTFITPEAYCELEKWINYRREAGEDINKNSWVMRQLWNTTEGYYHGIVTAPIKLKSSGIKRLIERSLWSQGIRKKSDIKRNRYEFQTDHRFRKYIIAGRNGNRNASRSLVVKYRMFDRMYEEDENYGFDINEDEIAESVLPYIISMQDIYSRLYAVS